MYYIYMCLLRVRSDRLCKETYLFLVVGEDIETHPAAVTNNARPLHHQLPVTLTAQNVELGRAAASAARLRHPANDLVVLLRTVEHRYVLSAWLEPRTREASEVPLERQHLTNMNTQTGFYDSKRLF